MKQIYNPQAGKHRRNGLHYQVESSEIKQFNDLGYLILNDVITEQEMQTLDPWFEHFIMGNEKEKMAKDFCDMSQPYGTPFEEFRLVNAMLPSMYCEEFSNNILQQISQNIANQLYRNGKAAIDYEQFLAKKPSKEKAAFAMHQDLGYWPKTKNTWTATFSLAMNDADVLNGCLYLIPGTNKEPELRTHKPKDYSSQMHDGSVNREDSHTLIIDVRPDDKIIYLPVKRGSITIHDERIVHGSAGNLSKEWRKTYIIAYRDVNTIAEERALGFTHSHNDTLNWEEIIT